MKNKELKSELSKLIDDIDDWEAEMELRGGHFIPAHESFTVSYVALKEMRAKGLVEYTMDYANTGGEVMNVSVTPKGYTYIEDEKDERNKWIVRTVLVGAGTSIVTSIITSLVVSLLAQR
ncbi:MAG: hypothetical protein LBP66_05180 [Lactococcus lactis]|jgi:DNA-binding PadR family transcriptional regulator|nr:hypothetical protein [Lactococcus lactis]